MPITHSHDVSGGGLCTRDASGCCAHCGVALVTCDACGGVGYHFDGCADGDEDICRAARTLPAPCACGRAALPGPEYLGACAPCHNGEESFTNHQGHAS